MGLVVVEDLEVGGGEAVDGVAVAVGDGDVGEDDAGFGVEGGSGLAGDCGLGVCGDCADSRMQEPRVQGPRSATSGRVCMRTVTD